jgi:hypothetical protein
MNRYLISLVLDMKVEENKEILDLLSLSRSDLFVEYLNKSHKFLLYAFKIDS